jgi:histidine phosphotransferase ChpT
MPKAIELLQALNAKICHDLAGPIGTVDNCLGMIDNKNQAIGVQAKDLAIAESANLVARIKFYRSAYGPTEGGSETSLVNLSKILQDFFVHSKIKLTFTYDKGLIFVDSRIAKMATCLVIIAEDAIVSKGKVNLSITSDETNPISVKCTGKNIVQKEECLNVLNGISKTPVTFRNCREHYIMALGLLENYKVESIKSAESLEFKLKKK